MKQLSNFIKVMPLSEFESFNGSSMAGLSEADLILSRNELILEENPKDTRAGILYEQKLTIITVDKLSDAQRKKYANRRPVMVLLYDDQGNPVLWGSQEERLRINIEPKQDRDLLTLERKATSPIF